MNSILRTVVMLVLSLVAAFSVSAQQNPKPKPGGSEKDSGKFYKLPATPENVQWGWFDVNEKPKLTSIPAIQFRSRLGITLSVRSSPLQRITL